MRPASDFDRIASNIAICLEYDSAVKAELYSICLTTASGTYLIDPILLQREALDEMIGSGPIAAIVVTNSNHHRASAQFAEQLAVAIFAHAHTIPSDQPGRLTTVADGDEICDQLRVISIDGAASGEIVLHYAANGGTLIVGDALINLEPYGFAFLPAKYCSDQREMRRSLRKLLDYEAERILFAHGTPILSRASQRLEALLISSSWRRLS
jgi:glyoxylase-like metal-dependent hydrolase (beta-lactamase superfamily II)